MPESGRQANPPSQDDNWGLTLTTQGCQTGAVNRSGRTPAQQDTIRRLKEVRAEALEHFRIAQDLARERRDLIRGLTGEGVSQAEIARELGVSRQAVQKMLAV
jgi:DNA-directed RNA polymerase specialized sigma24 family protein